MKLRTPRVALVWAQFAAYHEDRCIAVARRLAGRTDLVAVEVSSASSAYAWEPSGQIPGVRKVTLFPGESFERIGLFRRWWRQLKILRRCHAVFFGIGYNEPDVVVLSFTLRLLGVKVYVMTESKFDDAPRRIGREALKALLLSAYRGAIVGGRRQGEYLRFLGFRRRPVVPGYDGVGVSRIRAAVSEERAAPFAERGFLYVGRFVAKKNLAELVTGYALYAGKAGRRARRLTLAGSGPLEPALRDQIASLGIAELVDLPGFVDADTVARLLSRSLALILVSRVEQWGLVVNEAVAAGLPVIVAPPVGSGDGLVRNLINGFVIEHGSPEGLARALQILADDEATWTRMAAASAERAWIGDAERLADAIEFLLYPEAGLAETQLDALQSALGGEMEDAFEP